MCEKKRKMMDRKKLSNTGEMIMKNNMHAGYQVGDTQGRGYQNRGPNFINTFSSRMPSEAELKQAQQSLSLLKNQLKTVGGTGFNYGATPGYNVSPNRPQEPSRRPPAQTRGNPTLENIERKEKMLMDKIERLNDGLNMEDDYMKMNGYNAQNAGRSNNQVSHNYNARGAPAEEEFYRSRNNRADHMNNGMRRGPVQEFPEEENRRGVRGPASRHPVVNQQNGFSLENETDTRRNASPINNAYDRMNKFDEKPARNNNQDPMKGQGNYRSKFNVEDELIGGGKDTYQANYGRQEDKKKAGGIGKVNNYGEDQPIGGGARNNQGYGFEDDRKIGGSGNKGRNEREHRGGRGFDEEFAAPEQQARGNRFGGNDNAGIPKRNQQVEYEDNPYQEAGGPKNSRRNPVQQVSKKPEPRGGMFDEDQNDLEDDNRPLKDRDMNKAIKEAAQNDKYEEVFPCPEGCGRSFKAETLEKHRKVCKKVFQTKRKQFDETAMRLEGVVEDPSMIKQVKKKIQSKQPDPKTNTKKAGWKAQSEAFRAQMKAAQGGKMTKAEEDAVHEVMNAGLVPCPTCGRSFGEKAAKNHIPSCGERAKASVMKKGGSVSSKQPAPRGRK